MAQRTEVVLTCDLEESEKPAGETVRFAVDSSDYEIDLCDKHAKQFRDGLASFVAAGRRVSGSRTRGRTRSRSAAGGGDRRAAEIRAWARKKGITVSERGRLSSEVVARYEASGGK